jgi:hypothetical protein
MRIAVLVVALFAAGCGLKPAPITNPNLGNVGKMAVRAAQVVNAVDIGQRQIEPLVDAEVLTAPEGLSVAKGFGVALTQAKNLVAIFTLADAAVVISDQLKQLAAAREQAKALLQTVGNLGVGVSGFAGRIVVGALGARVSDAVGDLLPGGAQ